MLADMASEIYLARAACVISLVIGLLNLVIQVDTMDVLQHPAK